jgi:hypothetical protein
MQVLQENGAPVKMWTDGVPVEDEAKAQLLRTANLPFVYKHVAVMPEQALAKTQLAFQLPRLPARLATAAHRDRHAVQFQCRLPTPIEGVSDTCLDGTHYCVSESYFLQRMSMNGALCCRAAIMTPC